MELHRMDSSELNYEIIEEFVKEDDSIKDEEMKLLKEKILDFLANDMFLKPANIPKHKSVCMFKDHEVVFNNLLLNIVQLIRKLILFECFTPYKTPSKDVKGKLGGIFGTTKKEKIETDFSILVKSLLGILEFDTKFSDKRKKTQVQKKSLAENILGKIGNVTTTVATGIGQIFFAPGEKKEVNMKKKKRESLIKMDSEGIIILFIYLFI